MIKLIVLMLLTCTVFAPGSLKVEAKPDATVIAHLPVNPVETSAVFALHCQVSNLDDGQSVQIYKTTPGRSQQLSVGDSIIVPEERVFLASRHIGDGSIIYFMSIIDANIEDEADYSCKIVSTYPTLTEVAVDSVRLDVMFYPSVLSPQCADIQSDVIYEGDTVTLSCNSEIGNPVVSLKWKRTSDDNYLNVDEDIIDNRVYSTATLTAKYTDDGGVFLCEMNSKAFPEKLQTCHIGPLTIVRHSDRAFNPEVTTVALDKPKIPKQTISSGQDIPVTEQNCKEVCESLNKETVTYWVGGTIFAAALALLFCILCLVLLLKYCKHSTDNFPDYTPPIEDPEKIYVEVESKRDSGKMYMSLVKPYPETQFPQAPQKM